MKNKSILICIVLLALFARSYQLVERFAYDHDSDLSAWIFKDIVIDGHLRLIGQQTSSLGLFIGPLFYYSLIPFYLATNLDPIGTSVYPIIVGVVGVLSLYFVTAKTTDKKTAFFAALIYAGSFSISNTERQVVPTAWIFVWSIWFIYSVHLIYQGKKLGLTIAAVLLSLVWHIQLVLVIAAVPMGIAWISRFKSFKFRDFILPVALLVIISTPLILFELRHDFIQFRSLFFSSQVAEQVSRTLAQKSLHVLSVAAKNANAIFWVRPNNIPDYVLPLVILMGSGILLVRKKISRQLVLTFVLWFAVFIGFFIFHHINLSEYYINSLNIMWIILAALVLSRLGKLGSILLVVFLFYNLYIIITLPINRSGYLNRVAMVDYIAKDAKEHKFPCIAISFMTNPGYELGYRYLFWQKKMHVNRPSSNSPVYTIVFPHGRANRLDYTSGALGLVLPDYSRYNESGVRDSCSGENSNVTDPMFGFTK